MENNLKIMELQELPCRRRLNLFTIEPTYCVLYADGSVKRFFDKNELKLELATKKNFISACNILWAIHPNNSWCVFYFHSLRCAENFARVHSNSHSARYWEDVISHHEFFRKEIAIHLASRYSYTI